MAAMVVVLDEGSDLTFAIPGHVVVFQQDAVVEGLVPALDLALRLWVTDASNANAVIDRTLLLNPNSAWAWQSRMKEAVQAAANYRPFDMIISKIVETLPVNTKACVDRFCGGARKAGIPK